VCGIAGFAGHRCPEAAAGAAFRGALAHRGPDGAAQREWHNERGGWQLAHTRLSIVDLSDAGAQPMENEDGSLVMVFNGEIYNSPELRRYCEGLGHRFRSTMDGEVILHLWEIEGPACLTRLNGIFAVAMASTTTGEVVLARDPLGVKPLFYAAEPDGSLWFASEPAALRSVSASGSTSDVVALAQFLTFLWVPSPRSPFAGIRSLRPGRALRWSPADGGRPSEFRYGAPLVPAVGPPPVSKASVLEQAREQVRAAGRRQLLADVPIGLMASGGVDSGLLWWAAREGIDRAYTIRWSAGEDREGLDDDRRAVADLEGRFGTPVVYLDGEEAGDDLPPSGDLFADPAYGLTRLIAARAREGGHKVLLSGQGGDELFGGYRRHTVAPLLAPLGRGGVGAGVERLLRRVPSRRLATEYAARLARAARERDGFRAYMQLCSYSTAAERASVLGCAEAEVGDDVVWQHHQEAYDSLPAGLSFLRRVMAVDLGVYLPGLGLAYADRAGMESGVEVRVPWLDLELVRWSLQLPDAALTNWGRGKWVPRQLAAEVMSAEIAHRPKRAFAAPASRVGQEQGHGDRGFRQGAYFARARRLLDEHLGRETRVA
jgi:asparagine synthase (glutamine-hydrolysing)